MTTTSTHLTKQQIEQEYRRQLAINQALFMTLAVGVCVMNESGQIVTLNHAGARMLGWSESSVYGKNAHDIFECVVQEAGQETSSCPLASCVQTGTMIWSPRTRLRTRHGEWRWVELSSMALEDVGAPGVMMTFRDLSMEMQLREDSHQLASIPEESPFPIIEVDTSGNLLYANLAMTQLMQEADIGSCGFSAAFPPHFSHLIQECLEENVVKRDIEVHVGQREYAWLFSPHPELGLVRGFGMDISERKLAADELAAFADTLECKNRELDYALVKAEAATNAKAAFLATMSHEIRTPLNGVIGMTEMLMSTPLTSDQVECATLVKSSAEALMTIINDILDFSKIEAGKLNLENIHFDIRGLLEEVLDVFGERAHKKGLDLAGIVHPSIPVTLQGDPNRLRQILTNFIGNAIKFTEQGKVLVMIDSIVTNDTKSLPNGGGSCPSPPAGCVTLKFAVQDTGIGIPPETQDRLFQAFSQADASTTRKYGGTGLGLAISRQLVELMGGVIGVETNEGGGATFWCQMPFVLPTVHTKTGLPDYSLLSKERALCVGCPSATDQMMKGMFQEFGMQCAATTDCTQACAWLRDLSKETDPYTTVFVDSLIPETDQQKFIQVVKNDPNLTDVKVVALIPFGWRASDQKWERLGFDTVLSKPVHRAAFLRCFEPIRKDSPDRDTVQEETGQHTCSGSPELIDNMVDHSFASQRPSILVAEDNLVNQKVVSWALEKLGCQVTLVGNGREAVDASEIGMYDVILMDWQMPDMDGLEATRAIRAREVLDEERATSDERRATFHVPIIGMTANAMEGDRDQCLDAGMDDYMAKPIRAHQLTEMLEKWVPMLSLSHVKRPKASEVLPSRVGLQKVTSVSPPSKNENSPWDGGDKKDVYDVEKALQEVEGDWGLLRTLITIFLDSGPTLMKQIREAFYAGERETLRKHAHQLKGSFGALYAMNAAAASARLEKSADFKDSDSLHKAFKDLEQQFTDLLPVLQAVVAGGGMSSLENTTS